LLATTLRREDRGAKVSSKPTPSVANLLGLGLTTALCVVAGVGGGHWLDETLKTGLVFTFVGLVLGVAVAVAVVYFGIRQFL
jgi:hypothetical protein